MNTSIIIPYNHDRGYLSDAIRSAEGQGVVIPYQSDNTVGHNINKAVEQVETEFICILAEDDLLTYNSVQDRVEAIGSAPWIHARGVAFGPGYEHPINWTLPDPTLEEMLVVNRICGGTQLYRTDLFREVGGYDESLKTAEEYEFHLRLISLGHDPAFVDSVVYKWRRHNEQKSLGSRTDQRERQQYIDEKVRAAYS